MYAENCVRLSADAVIRAIGTLPDREGGWISAEQDAVRLGRLNRGKGRQLALVCPTCGRTFVVLYHARGQTKFRCRLCLRLRYVSSYKWSPLARQTREANTVKPESIHLLS